jgi:hypothetical protein
MLPRDIFSINRLTKILKIIGQTHDVYQLKRLRHFKGLDKHYHWYHSSFHQTHRYTEDNVCLNFHNCHYPIYITYTIKTEHELIIM